jgi:hypothetical protein
MRRIAFLTVALLGALASTAAAVGPSPGQAPALLTADARFTATPTADGWDTVVRTGDVRRTLAGAWGFPKVTYGGAVEGLSRDGRTLVLAERTQSPTSPTRFLVVDPQSLQVRKRIALPGRFAFDALSPNARTMYLVEYVTVNGELRYRVRSYDLAANRLARQAIADKRSRWTTMEGMPMARATSRDGTWVYTLYANGPEPFVHALNARQGYALCIDLPVGFGEVEGGRLRLDGGRLDVLRSGRVRATIDTASLQVVRQ